MSPGGLRTAVWLLSKPASRKRQTRAFASPSVDRGELGAGVAVARGRLPARAADFRLGRSQHVCVAAVLWVGAFWLWVGGDLLGGWLPVGWWLHSVVEIVLSVGVAWLWVGGDLPGGWLPGWAAAP
jgi:hypothetical protein